MGILITITALILLGTFWRQILAGSMMLIAVAVFGIFVILAITWWSSRNADDKGFDHSTGWQKTEAISPANALPSSVIGLNA